MLLATEQGGSSSCCLKWPSYNIITIYIDTYLVYCVFLVCLVILVVKISVVGLILAIKSIGCHWWPIGFLPVCRTILTLRLAKKLAPYLLVSFDLFYFYSLYVKHLLIFRSAMSEVNGQPWWQAIVRLPRLSPLLTDKERREAISQAVVNMNDMRQKI